MAVHCPYEAPVPHRLSGVVYDNGDTETDTVLKGVVRVERIDVLRITFPLFWSVQPAHITKPMGLKIGLMPPTCLKRWLGRVVGCARAESLM